MQVAFLIFFYYCIELIIQKPHPTGGGPIGYRLRAPDFLAESEQQSFQFEKSS